MAKTTAEKQLAASKGINIGAKGVSILAPIVAAATQFPMWVEKGAETTSSGIALSGAFVTFALISFIPALKGLKSKLKNPTAFFMWAVMFGAVAALRPIIDELYLITLVGVASNGGGFLLSKYAKFLNSRGNNDEANQVRQLIKSGGNLT